MAVRREQVIADLQDNVTPGLARMAVAAGVADRAIKSMGGTSVSTGRDLDKTATGVDKVSTSSRRGGPDIDKFSGRLRTMADAAAVLGPALIPLGASAIPVLTASLVGLSSAAGALGITVLAFQGLGDGLRALDKAQLEPTAENLNALRLEMEKLGPAGAHFVHFLDDLEPTLRDLQNVARAGVFPGLEDGITDMLTRLPQVKRIVADLADGMGDLARDAGESLGGDDFTAFFNYMETDARPTLEAFAHSIGNVAQGVANMLVAFAPLNRDFTGGLEDATKAFADWSKGLDDNESFQEFLSYVRESGPQVIDFLAALVSALTGLIQAAAPLGQVVLPALTGMANVFALIAKSPIGPGLYTAAAALIAFNRAASIAGKTSDKFSTTWGKMSTASKVSGGIGGIGLLASSLTDLDDKAGLANTAMFSMAGLMVGGPWGLAIGAGIGLVADLADANNDMGDAARAAQDAMNSGDIDLMKAKYKDLGDEIRETAEASNPNNFAPGGGDGNPLSKSWGFLAAQWSNLSGETDDVKDTFNELGDAIGHSINDVGLFGLEVGSAASRVENLSRALGELQGWLDKRAAIRDYRDSIKELAKGIKDGFGRKDVENLDAVGENIIKVANSIKDPALRGDFLTGAANSLQNLADNSGPKAAGAIQRLLDKMAELDVAHPDVKITADDRRAQHVVDQVQAYMNALSGKTANPKVSVNPGDSFSILGGIRSELARIVSKTITLTVKRVGSATEGMFDTGGFTGRGGHLEPAGIVHRNEIVIPERYARRDFGMLRARYPDLPGFAGGGMVPDIHTGRYLKNYDGGYMTDVRGGGGRGGGKDDVANAIHILVAPIWSAANLLKSLNKELERQQKAYDKAKSMRDDAISRRDAISGSIQQGLAGDSIWADIPAKGGVWAAGSTPGGKATPASALAALQARKDRAQRLVAAINTLKAKGVTGPALLEIIGDGDVERAEAMAALDIGSLSGFAGAVNESNSALAAAGLAGGNAIEGDNVNKANRRLDRLHDDLQEVKHAINRANNDNKDAQDKNAKDVKDGVNGAAASGHRKKKR